MKNNDSASLDTVLIVDKVCKSFVKGKIVNDNISLSLQKGEIFGLLGPNGAGKTTLVNQIIGLKKPDSGRITLAGVDVVANPGYARQACSFQAQTQVPISGLTTRQAIELVGQVRGGSVQEVRKRTGELIHKMEMDDWANKNSASFSGGMRRLVAFCMAVVVPGRVVILDEPTNDVDPLRRRLLWNQVRFLAESGSAILLVTHNVLEAERAVDRMAIINDGKVVRIGTPASLKDTDGENMRLELILEPGQETPVPPSSFKNNFHNGHRFVIQLHESQVLSVLEWARYLKEQGKVQEFSIGPTSLEDAYMRIVGRSDALEVAV